MTYAIIDFAGKQFKVTPNGKVVVTGEFGEPATKHQVSILLLQNGEITVGTPITKETCTLEVVAVKNGPKTRVATYHPKARHRRVVGHRQLVTEFKVLDWTNAQLEAKPKNTKKVAASKSKKI